MKNAYDIYEAIKSIRSRVDNISDNATDMRRRIFASETRGLLCMQHVKNIEAWIAKVSPATKFVTEEEVCRECGREIEELLPPDNDEEIPFVTVDGEPQ